MGSFPENDDAETNAEAEAEPEQGNGGAAAQNGAADFPAPSAQEFTGSIDRSWHRHSFSSVTHNSRSGHGIEQEERDEPAEADAAEGEEEAAARKPFLSPESFPRAPSPDFSSTRCWSSSTSRRWPRLKATADQPGDAGGSSASSS